MSEWMEWGLGEPQPMPDPARVSRARAELIEFCESEYSRLVRFLMFAGALPEIAEAAARETFAAWWASLAADPGRWWEDRRDRPAWARMLALQGRVLMAARGRTRAVAVASPGTPDAAGCGGLAVQARELLDALRTLEAESRHVLAFVADGFAPGEIAQALRMTGQQVQAIKQAACARLGQAIAEPAGLRGDGGQWDEFLRAAMSSLPEASAGIAGVLAEIMAGESLRVPLRLTTVAAVELIRARVHARRLALAAADGAVAAHVIRKGLAGPDPELALPAASETARGVGRARENLLALGPGVDLGADLDHDAVLAGELLEVLARSDRFDVLRASDLAVTLHADLAEVRMNSLDLVRGLARLPADASGADLSGIDIRHLSPLDGVTWTGGTTWPPGIADRIQPHSGEVRPGTYRIHIPYTDI